MTDLEALECIVVDLTPKAKEHNKEEIEQVEKSLEVLEQLETLKKYYPNNTPLFLTQRQIYAILKSMGQ